MRRFYLYLDGHRVGKKVKSERPLVASNRIFKRIVMKTGIIECEFDIIEKKSGKIYSYLGRVEKLPFPIKKTIGENTFYVYLRYIVKRQ